MNTAMKFSKKFRTNLTIVFSGREYPFYPFRKGPLKMAKWYVKKWTKECMFRCRFGVRLIILMDVNEFQFQRRIRGSDQGVIAGFNQIFKQSLIAKFGEIVNFHASLLRFYRGPMPTYWCLKNGEKRTGFTMHRLTEKVDEGEILYQGAVDITPSDDERSLDEKISTKATETFWRYLESLQTGKSWTKRNLNAYSFYRTHMRYAPFPHRSVMAA